MSSPTKKARLSDDDEEVDQWPVAGPSGQQQQQQQQQLPQSQASSEVSDEDEDKVVVAQVLGEVVAEVAAEVGGPGFVEEEELPQAVQPPTPLDSQGRPKNSFSRFGDDLQGELLSYLPFDNQ